MRVLVSNQDALSEVVYGVLLDLEKFLLFEGEHLLPTEEFFFFALVLLEDEFVLFFNDLLLLEEELLDLWGLGEDLLWDEAISALDCAVYVDLRGLQPRGLGLNRGFLESLSLIEEALFWYHLIVIRRGEEFLISILLVDSLENLLLFKDLRRHMLVFEFLFFDVLVLKLFLLFSQFFLFDHLLKPFLLLFSLFALLLFFNLLSQHLC